MLCHNQLQIQQLSQTGEQRSHADVGQGAGDKGRESQYHADDTGRQNRQADAGDVGARRGYSSRASSPRRRIVGDRWSPFSRGRMRQLKGMR